MGEEVIPGRHLAVEIEPVDVGQGTETQIPLVGVVAVEPEAEVRLRRLHQRGVLETVAEAESAVMVKVIAQELVCRRRLFGGGSKRRMRVQERHRSEPGAVRDAQDAHAAIMVRNMFQQPVDAVVNVCALIDGVGITPVMLDARGLSSDRDVLRVASLTELADLLGSDSDQLQIGARVS